MDSYRKTINAELIAKIYADSNGELSNEALYSEVARRTGLTESEMNTTRAVGKAGTQRKVIPHKVRWFQQTLKAMGIIEKTEGKATWRHTRRTLSDLDEAREGTRILAYATSLGIAILSDAESFFRGFSEPVHLGFTSPPYPLQKARAYGGPSDELEWIDFITRVLEPICRNLVSGGSVCLNLGNDIFVPGGKGERSLYQERLVLALNDRLGLKKIDMIPWVNRAKPPGPTEYACKRRTHLSSGWESLYWFSNSPSELRSDNRRVLNEHTMRHKKLLMEGNKRQAVYGDGAYKLRESSYSNQTEGSIPKNVFERGNACADTLAFRKFASKLGLPHHGAMFPTALASFFIKFLTREGDLVIDPFCGSNKTGLAAQRLNRRFVSVDRCAQFLRTSAELFRNFPDFMLNPFMLNYNR